MSTPKILIADDEDMFAIMLQRSLAMFGYEVIRARNGREALRLYDPATVGLVLTDLIMPDMEGLELIVALRKANPAVKVIAMSGGGRNHPQAYLAIAEKVGAVRSLAKPFTITELVATVQESLDAPRGRSLPARPLQPEAPATPGEPLQ